MSVAAMSVHPAANLFPLLGDEELRLLADDIAAHGLLEPVWLYDDPDRGVVLLDGRNRVRACALAGIEPTTRWYTGTTPVAFAYALNLTGRRHLTVGQKAFAAAAAVPLLAEEAAKRKALRERDERGRLTSAPITADPQEQVREPRRERESYAQAAKPAGIGARAVAQAVRVARDAPDLAEQVKAGTLAIDRAERLVRDREAEARRIEQAKREAASAVVAPRIDVRHGDFREVLADVRGLDAIITDPPYPAEFLPLLSDLASWADLALAPHGVLAVLIGQTHLPEVYERLSSGGRPYRWTACYLTDGPGYVSHARHVQSSWKPLLVFGGERRFSDVIRSTGDDKQLHRWGQNFDAFRTIIERLTEAGQTVADPFMGAGTTLLAAQSLGRHAIGCDTDPAAVEAARLRVA